MKIDVIHKSELRPVAIDEDGTPLQAGERMVEVEPGLWKSPTTIAIEKFLDEKLGSISV